MFSGIGGIDLAFLQAGFEIAWAIDKDADCCKTYRHNFHGSNLIESDIRKVDPTLLESIDVLAAGFPCQSFSVAGQQRGFKDDRGVLFYEGVRFANALKPRFIFLENVPNLMEHDNGRTFLVIHDTLSDIGYTLKYKVMRASEYGGVPQIRDRIYIVAFRDIEDCDRFSFPEKIELSQGIDNVLATTEKKHDIYYYNSFDPFYTIASRIVRQQGVIYRVYHDSIKPTQNHMCPTLTASMGTQLNQVPLVKDEYGIRKLTIRECLDFQGFQKGYKFPKTISLNAAYKQVGNTVCVPVVERIVRFIKEAYFDKEMT